MKILTIQNQKMQNLQNSNNLPVAFGDLRGLVAGDSNILGKRTAALAFKLTEKDFPRNGHLSREVFARDGIDSDVLQIGVKGFEGISGTQHVVCVNHQDVLGPGLLSSTLVEALNPLNAILRRIQKGVKGIYMPGSLFEKRRMQGFLQGNGNFKFEETELDDPGKIQSVANLLLSILEKVKVPK